MAAPELLRYWPTEEDVVACVKTDAEAASEAVSLAVHQPMTFEVRPVAGEGDRSAVSCDERGLLHAFLNPNLPEGRVILPIVGESGVGKSHVVRWLDAQLRMRPDRDRRLVIRIPKGMSLKGILGLILDKTTGKGFEKHRRELERAQESIDPLRAAGQLCEDLAQTLHEMFEHAKRCLEDNPTDRLAREREAFCRRDYLQALFRNQHLRDAHFVCDSGPGAGPVWRLVEHLSESRAAGTEDDRKHVFVEDDLRIADHVDLPQLGPAERRAIGDLEREDRRRTAVLILNEALDGAKQRLLRTDPAVSDLFEAVRRDLLRAKRELVLLVEDFAVLSGLQGQLLQVVIKEAVREGRQELCTMRTALAYTSGYRIPETVRTRAGVEYIIPTSSGDDAGTLERIERLVGAYLNAARLGQERLEGAYRKAGTAQDQPTGWVPKFEARLEPDDAATIKAFGESPDGFALFPFNREAIHSLAREACTEAGNLIYNPRFVILRVINRVLERRDDFLRGAFPSPAFGGAKLPAGLTTDVQRRVPTAEVAERWLRVLAYWGGPIEALDELEVSARVFLAFGLKLEDLGRTPRRPPVERGREEPKPPPTVESPEERGVRELRLALEGWRRGERMRQVDARNLRNKIAAAIDDAIDWDWWLFRPLKGADVRDWAEHVFIPNASNVAENATTAMLAVCSEEALGSEIESASVTETLVAVYRLQMFPADHKGDWSDFARNAIFMDQHLEHACQWMMARPLRARWDPVPALVGGLLIGARALGVPGAGNHGDVAAVVDSLFTSAPEGQPAESESLTPSAQRIGVIREALARCRRAGSEDAPSWQDLLLEVVGARQGQGPTAYAIDPLRLKAAIETTLRGWEFTPDIPARGPSHPVLDRMKVLSNDLRGLAAALDQERERLLEWRRGMLEWLGDEFDCSEVAGELRETINVAVAEGFAEDFDAPRTLGLVEDFRQSGVATSLEAVAGLEGLPDRGTLLTVVGQRLDPVVSLCTRLRSEVTGLLESAHHQLRVRKRTIGRKSPIQEAAKSLVRELELIENLTEELS